MTVGLVLTILLSVQIIYIIIKLLTLLITRFWSSGKVAVDGVQKMFLVTCLLYSKYRGEAGLAEEHT